MPRQPFERAFVHVGLHKTGTTTIQRTLFDLRERLSREHGIHYPTFPEPSPVSRPPYFSWLYSRFCDEPHRYRPNVDRGYTTPDRAASINRIRGDSLDAALTNREERAVLLSEEDLSLLSVDGLLRFKRWLTGIASRIDVVILLREPISWATSRIVQAVRERMTLEQLYEDPPSFKGMRDRLVPWLELFGGEAIHVHDFEAAVTEPHGIVGEFCRVLGVPESILDGVEASRRLNRSMSAFGVQLLSALNLSRPYFADGGISSLRTTDDHQFFERVRGPRFQLPADVVERVIEESRDDCAWVCQTFGIEYSPERSSHPRPATAGEYLPFDRATIDSLAMLLGDAALQRQALRGLEREVIELRQAIDRLTSEHAVDP